MSNQNWTYMEQRELIKLWNESGKSVIEIADILNRPVLGVVKRIKVVRSHGTYMVFQEKRDQKKRGGAIKNPTAKTEEEIVDRICSKCKKPFRAEGRFIRICTLCTAVNKRSGLPPWMI